MGLLEYFNSFKVPSDVLWIDFRSGKSSSIHQDAKLAVTDVALGPGRHVLAAGIAVNGLRALPIPAKVQFVEATVSDGQITAWKQIDADYRAVARRVHLATSPAGANWAVTDTGFILRLDRSSAR